MKQAEMLRRSVALGPELFNRIMVDRSLGNVRNEGLPVAQPIACNLPGEILPSPSLGQVEQLGQSAPILQEAPTAIEQAGSSGDSDSLYQSASSKMSWANQDCATHFPDSASVSIPLIVTVPSPSQRTTASLSGGRTSFPSAVLRR